jgi:hypothetical protein
VSELIHPPVELSVGKGDIVIQERHKRSVWMLSCPTGEQLTQGNSLPDHETRKETEVVSKLTKSAQTYHGPRSFGMSCHV